MKIISATPFHLESGGELIVSENPGFHKINMRMEVLSVRTRAGHENGYRGVDSIPSVVAHAIKFKADLLDKGCLEGYREQSWRKVMCLFVLSQYKIMDVNFKIIGKDEVGGLIWEIFGRKLAAMTGFKEKILLLEVDGRALAVFDQDAVLIPMAEDQIDICIADNGLDKLNTADQALLAGYLETLSSMRAGFSTYVSRFAATLHNGNHSGAAAACQTQVMREDLRNLWGLNDSVKRQILTLPGLPIRIPKPFHDWLILSPDALDGNDRNRTITFSVTEESGVISRYSALLPLSEGLTDYMEENDDVRLERAYAESSRFAADQRLEIYLVLNIKGQMVTFRNVYSRKRIIFLAGLPSISLYPYVSLPEDKWKDYNLVLLPCAEERRLPPLMISAKNISRGNERMVDIMEANRRQTDGSGQFVWYYAKRKRLPRYVKLCFGDFGLPEKERNARKGSQYIGCISAGEPTEGAEQFDKTYRWAIDFGTRNTIVASKIKGGKDIRYEITRSGLLKRLTSDANDFLQSEFANQFYAPLEGKAGKFHTMCTVYSGTAYENRCYEHGCAIFPDASILEKLLRRDTSLLQNRILTDLKFGGGGDLNVAGLELYLKNMLWLGCLEALLNGADTLEAVISYPRKEIYKKIVNVWGSARDYMESICGLKINMKYFTEAEANSRYLQRMMADKPLFAIGENSVYGIMDIGAGTSDLNIYLRPQGEEEAKQLQFSVRYAGEQLMVDSIETYCRDHRKFWRQLWKMEEEEGNPYYEAGQFLLDTYEQGLQPSDPAGSLEKDDTKKEIIALLLEEFGINSRISISEKETDKEFLAILKVKYMSLFKMYADLLKNYHVLTGENNFKLFLFGGGRHGLSVITGEPLEHFSQSEFGREIRGILAEGSGIPVENIQIITDGNRIKNEVAAGMADDEIQDIPRQRFCSRENLDQLYEASGGARVRTDCAWNSEFKEMLANRYMEFIEIYQSDPSIYERLAIKGDGQRRRAAAQRYEENRSDFNNAIDDMWNKVSADQENPENLIDTMFCLRMADFMLMRTYSQKG